jgi:hypothetical protein
MFLEAVEGGTVPNGAKSSRKIMECELSVLDKPRTNHLDCIYFAPNEYNLEPDCSIFKTLEQPLDFGARGGKPVSIQTL